MFRHEKLVIMLRLKLFTSLQIPRDFYSKPRNSFTTSSTNKQLNQHEIWNKIFCHSKRILFYLEDTISFLLSYESLKRILKI